MKRRNVRVLALVPLAFSTVLAPVAFVFLRANPNDPFPVPAASAYLVGVIAFPLVGALVASRHPGNPIGWILSAAGLVTMLQVTASIYSEYGFSQNPRPLGTVVTAWFADVVWLPSIALSTAFLFLLFPSGRFLTGRWRPFGWLAVGGTALSIVGQWFEPTLYSHPSVRAPFALSGVLQGVANALVGLGFFFLLGGTIAGVVSLIARLRRSHGEERQQIKWFVYSATVVILLLIPMFFSEDITEGDSLLVIAASLAGLLIPISVGLSILKYRLYDIDIVINKTVVYGALAAFITLVYVGIVVGIGSAIGEADRPNLGLSILATAVVAVAFQPVRERVQRFANRLVYGKRATPYEVLSHFGERMASTVSTEDLLPRMAEILALGTGAARTEVWLKVGSELRRAAAFPTKAHNAPEVLPLSAGELPSIEDVDRSIPVRHQGELLGALSVTKARGEPLTPADAKLLEDLASQAGLVLRNVQLIEELRASRQRLVAAQDEERRKIERNIHDGAQQQLVALNVKLGLAKTLLRKNAQKTQEMMEQLQAETVDALENLRDLARGIYPPLLADKGLAAAVEAQARKASIPVAVHAEALGRYQQETEAAVYFSVLEALQNVAKYAAASRAVVDLTQNNGELVFEVRDDGKGFDHQETSPGSGLTNMADRVEALGGTLEVSSHVGRGTTVRGRLPVQPTDLAVVQPDAMNVLVEKSEVTA